MGRSCSVAWKTVVRWMVFAVGAGPRFPREDLEVRLAVDLLVLLPDFAVEEDLLLLPVFEEEDLEEEDLAEEDLLFEAAWSSGVTA
jgi:hypothetical protein